MRSHQIFFAALQRSCIADIKQCFQSLVLVHHFGTQYKQISLTGKDFMDHTMLLDSGAHLTLPTEVLNLGESASFGTGT